MRGILIAFLAAALLASCATRQDRVYFDGKYYPAKYRAANKNDRTYFTATIRRVSQGVTPARAAAEHAGRQYCVNYFGTSKIAWISGPDAPLQTIMPSRNRMQVSGKCVVW